MVSLAYKLKSKKFEVSTISLIYIRNNNGPRIEPRGTPHVINLREEEAPL